MRRSTIVVPLLLIAVGALFLINNLRPDLSLLRLVARYWPFLLIAWGVIRLAEISISAIGADSSTTRGMSGGEWALVALVIFFGVTIQGAMGLADNWSHFGPIRIHGMRWLGQPFDYPIPEQKQDAPKSAHVIIENLRGNARITGTGADSVTVSGRKTIRALRQSDADAANKQSLLDFAVQGNRVTIRTNQERVSGDHEITEDLEITVPRGISVEVHGRYGDFEISDIDGEVDVDSDNAGVRLQNIGGRIRVDTRRSDIIRASNAAAGIEIKGGGQDVELENIKGQVLVNGSYSGDLQFRNVEKAIHFESPRTRFEVGRLSGQARMSLGDFSISDAVGPFRITAKSKDVHLVNVTNSAEVDVKRGDIEVVSTKTPVPKLNLRTAAGNIEVALPAQAKFELHADTRRGDINNDFGEGLKQTSSGRSANLAGGVGNGPLIQMETLRGDITVRRAGAEEELSRNSIPVPPKPPLPPKAPWPKVSNLEVQTQ